jgi:hypothetical protein
MNIQKLLLRLYPRAWRERYEEEFLVVLAAHPFSFFEGIDIMRGAIDAHLHPSFGTTDLSWPEKMKQMLLTLRSSLLMIFCAYSGFIVAGMAFQKLTEAHEFAMAAHTYSVLGVSFDLVLIGAVTALLAALIGGLPVVADVVKGALARKRYSLLILLATPIFALAFFISTTFLLEKLVSLKASSSFILLSRGIFLTVFLGTAIVSATTVCCAVVRSEIEAKRLRFAALPSLLLTLSMALMLVAVLIWGLGLRSSIPQLFESNEGMFGTSTSGSWLKIVLMMAGATGLATFSLFRGFAARSVLSSARP